MGAARHRTRLYPPPDEELELDELLEELELLDELLEELALVELDELLEAEVLVLLDELAEDVAPVELLEEAVVPGGTQVSALLVICSGGADEAGKQTLLVLKGSV